MNYAKWLFSVLVIFFTLSAQAQTVTHRHFIYDGNVSYSRFFKQNALYTSTRGWYFSFGGSAHNAGCSDTSMLLEGPVLEATGLFDYIGDTGIGQGAPGNNFTPSSNSPQCTVKDRWGDTHAHFKNTTDSLSPAGIGLHTTTGPLTYGSRPLAFFQPLPPSDGNANIMSNFAGFNCGYSACTAGAADPANTFPFSGISNDFNTLRFAVLSNQFLTRFALDAPSSQQVRQQIALTLRNVQSGSEVQYLFFTAIKGVWIPTGLNDANVRQDPVQGGMSYVDGPIGSVGQSTGALHPKGSPNANSYQLWTSWANPTEYFGPWMGQKSFQVEVTFNQFLTLLKLATANSLQKSVANVTEADIIQRYGASYKVPGAWMLYGTAVAHEVSNSAWQTSTAVAGGGFTSLKILSLPLD